jgi:hypothetical protein
LFMINPDNDPEKDIDMVQHLLGEFGLPEKWSVCKIPTEISIEQIKNILHVCWLMCIHCRQMHEKIQFLVQPERIATWPLQQSCRKWKVIQSFYTVDSIQSRFPLVAMIFLWFKAAIANWSRNRATSLTLRAKNEKGTGRAIMCSMLPHLLLYY